MTDRTDHTARAEGLLSRASGSSLEVAKEMGARAQVHATLALVEQQRITNEHARINSLSVYAITRAAAGDSPVLAEIREALGLS